MTPNHTPPSFPPSTSVTSAWGLKKAGTPIYIPFRSLFRASQPCPPRYDFPSAFQALGVGVFEDVSLLVRAVRLVVVAVGPQHVRQVGATLVGIGRYFYVRREMRHTMTWLITEHMFFFRV